MKSSGRNSSTRLFAVYRAGSVAVCVFLAVACGSANKPQYVDYTKGNTQSSSAVTGGGTATSGDSKAAASGPCADAAQLFNASVQDEVGAKCSNAACHGSGGSGAAKLALSAKDVTANRDAMKKFLAGDDQRIDKEFKKTPPHPGGNLSESLTLTEIRAWLAAEAKCGA